MKIWFYKLEDKELEINEEALIEAIEKEEFPKDILIRDESMDIWVKASSINGLLPPSKTTNRDDVPEHIGSYILGAFLFLFWLLEGAELQIAFGCFIVFLIMHYIDIPRFKRNLEDKN